MNTIETRDNWVNLLKKIGLNPIVPDNDPYMIEVDYFGHLISIIFHMEDLILIGCSICLLKNSDAIMLNHYLEAVRVASEDEAVPKIILLQPYATGERPIQAWHSLFLDFNFEDRSLEDDNKETLIRILNSLLSASKVIVQYLSGFDVVIKLATNN